MADGSGSVQQLRILERIDLEVAIREDSGRGDKKIVPIDVHAHVLADNAARAARLRALDAPAEPPRPR